MQRYEVLAGGHHGEGFPDPDGEWVSYDDAHALEAALRDAYWLVYHAWSSDRFGPDMSDAAKELRREMAGVLAKVGLEPPAFPGQGPVAYRAPWYRLEAENAALKARVQEIEGGRLLEDALAEGSRLMAENAALRENLAVALADRLQAQRRVRRELVDTLAQLPGADTFLPGSRLDPAVAAFLIHRRDVKSVLDRICPEEPHPTAPASPPEDGESQP